MTVQTTNKTTLLPVGEEGNFILQWAEELFKTPYYQKLGKGGILAIILTAREMGVPAMQALNGALYPVNGKIGISAQLMQILIESNENQINIIESTKSTCTLEFIIKNKKNPVKWTYTIEDAQLAKLTGKDNWRQYPRDMLFCRCLASGARKICPSAIFGLYLKEELEDITSKTKVSSYTENETVKQEDHKKKESDDKELIEEFANRHNLYSVEAKEIEYLEECSKNSGLTYEKTVAFAAKNEDHFVKSYSKWLNKNEPEEKQN